MDKKVQQINAAIVAHIKAILGNRTDIQSYCLAEPVVRVFDNEVTAPVIYLPGGECIDVFGEADTHDLVIYHRLQSVSYQESKREFGDRKIYEKRAEISIVVLGKRTNSQYDVEKTIVEAISKNKECNVSGSDFNALQIFATEYSGLAYFFGTEYFLFKTNYSITSTCNDGCINN